MGEKIEYMQFNQDYTSLNIATTGRWSLNAVGNGDKLEKIFDGLVPEGAQIVEQLFSSSLVAVSLIQSPRKLRVWHHKKGNEILNYSYGNTVLGVRLNRARLVVCLEDMLHIHNVRDMKIMHTIRDTPCNSKGLLALSSNAELSYLAYPGSSVTGQVQIFDAFNLQSKMEIHAHNSTLAALSFNNDCTMLATASEKGTVIRIYSLLDGSRLYEYRRGMKRCANIFSIAFSLDSQFLALSSNTETIHVFKIDPSSIQLLQQKQQQQLQSNKLQSNCTHNSSGGGNTGSGTNATSPSPNNLTSNRLEKKDSIQSAQNESIAMGWMDWMKSTLPAQMTQVWAQGRAFATISTPFHDQKSIVAIKDYDPNTKRILVASYDGYLYVYSLNVNDGGECSLVKQHKLLEDMSNEKKSAAAGVSYAGAVKESEQLDELSGAASVGNSPPSPDTEEFPNL